MLRCAVNTDQPVLAADFPVISFRISAIFDASEEPFRSRAIARHTTGLCNGHEVFSGEK